MLSRSSLRDSKQSDKGVTPYRWFLSRWIGLQAEATLSVSLIRAEQR